VQPGPRRWFGGAVIAGAVSVYLLVELYGRPAVLVAIDRIRTVADGGGPG
jgi:hypothetical protein